MKLFSTGGLLALLLVSASACAGWSCYNDFESRCDHQGCSVALGEEFTPLSISVTDDATLTVCAYSGCWEGPGKVLAHQPFLVILGEALPWNFPGSDDRVTLLLSINPAKGTGALSSPHFDQPLICSH